MQTTCLYKTRFRAASINVFSAIPAPLRFTSLHTRSKHFGEAFYNTVGPDVDVICMQELIFGRSTILGGLVHHPYTTPIVRSSLLSNNIKFVQSGLCIASKWPIVCAKALLFEGPTYHVERLCAKGALYACIRTPTAGDVHVINVHLNAWSCETAERARLDQVRQIVQWLPRLGIQHATDEAFFLGGDVNTCFYEHGLQVAHIAQVLGATICWPEKTSFSFDSRTNALVGLDDPKEYRCKNQEWGCYDELLLEGSSASCPRQLVDGFFWFHLHRPPDVLTTQVVPLLTRNSYEIEIAWGVKRSVQNVTDHAAVVIEAKWKEAVPPSHSPVVHPLRIEYDQPRVNGCWLLLQIVVSCLFLALFVLAWCALES
jgi:endonuclease/exonuclease/phosphatase family metal-dependent hydrolase